MKAKKQNRMQGFTLVELMVSMALGLLVMAAMANLFKTGIDSTKLVIQRAETQENMRAAMDLMVKDISVAGSGLQTGGIQLPNGTGATASNFGCDQTGTCHTANFTYPAPNYMYGVVPGFQNGVEGGAVIPAAPAPAVNDSITVIYVDYNFRLDEWNVSFTTPGSGTGITLAATNPSYPSPPNILAAGGIQVGDLIMLSNNLGYAVGEVTAPGPTATSISFANSDPLNMNQDGAQFNNIKAISGGTNTVAYRLYAVTYYLTVPVAPQKPRLMRQVNGLPPVPVADDIINLQFTFDVYNSTTSALDPSQANPIGVGESPNLIQKINIVLMGQSMINNGNKSQNMYLATSVSARNMAFRNRYQ